jgi:hypothetical protein
MLCSNAGHSRNIEQSVVASYCIQPKLLNWTGQSWMLFFVGPFFHCFVLALLHWSMSVVGTRCVWLPAHSHGLGLPWNDGRCNDWQHPGLSKLRNLVWVWWLTTILHSLLLQWSMLGQDSELWQHNVCKCNLYHSSHQPWWWRWRSPLKRLLSTTFSHSWSPRKT